MTVPEVALRLLPMIGIRTLDPNWDGNDANQPGLVTGDLEEVALAITQALQEIFGLGPSQMSEQRYSVVLRAPKSVSFTAAQFSTAIAGFVGWEEWMVGCTVQGGDQDDNELVSATELVRPFMGQGAVVSATVYSDTVVLPSWIKNTIEPVESGLIPHLRAAQNRDDFRGYTAQYQGSNGPRFHPGRSSAHYLTMRNKTTGDPANYLVEPRYQVGAGPLQLFMRFNPMPPQVTAISFNARRKPPVVTVDDINGANLFPNVLQVTSEALTPDATGYYGRLYGQLSGDNGNLPTYGRIAHNNTNIDWQIRFNYAIGGGLWTIEPTSGNLSAGYFAQLTAGPLGTYYTASPGTGVAVVTSVGAYGPDNTAALNLPTDWHQTILVPIARKFFMAHPSFDNKSLEGEIMRQYQTARDLLEGFKPQIAPTEAEYH